MKNISIHMHEIVVNRILNYMLSIKQIFMDIWWTPLIYFVFTVTTIPSVTIIDKYALSFSRIHKNASWLSGKYCLKPLFEKKNERYSSVLKLKKLYFKQWIIQEEHEWQQQNEKNTNDGVKGNMMRTLLEILREIIF